MKKKKIVSIITAMLIVGVLAGCSSKQKCDNGNSYNKKYSSEQMVNVKGKDIKVKDNKLVKTYKESGFGYVKCDQWNDLSNVDGVDAYLADDNTYYMMYMPKEQVDILNAIDKENMSEDDIKKTYNTAYDSEFYVFSIYKVNSEDKDSVSSGDDVKSNFSNVEEVGKVGKNTYYFAYNDKLPSEGFSDDDKEDIQKMLDTISEVKDNIILFTPVNLAEEFKSASMAKFTTKDLEGNEVTEDIIKKYDLTMVNVWATWCQYCVEEMPEIQELYKEIPKNVNIITICTDGETESDTAKEVLSKSNAEFTTLTDCDAFEEHVLEYVTGYPTTFFVDKEGKVVGKLQVGTPSDDGNNKDAYMELINDALKDIK